MDIEWSYPHAAVIMFGLTLVGASISERREKTRRSRRVHSYSCAELFRRRQALDRSNRSSDSR